MNIYVANRSELLLRRLVVAQTQLRMVITQEMTAVATNYAPAAPQCGPDPRELAKQRLHNTRGPRAARWA